MTIHMMMKQDIHAMIEKTPVYRNPREYQENHIIVVQLLL